MRANCVLAELNPIEKEGKHKMTELLSLKMYTLTNVQAIYTTT